MIPIKLVRLPLEGGGHEKGCRIMAPDLFDKDNLYSWVDCREANIPYVLERLDWLLWYHKDQYDKKRFELKPDRLRIDSGTYWWKSGRRFFYTPKWKTIKHHYWAMLIIKEAIKRIQNRTLKIELQQQPIACRMPLSV